MTWRFDATVIEVNDAPLQLPFTPAIGDSVVYFLTFDTSTPGHDPVTPPDPNVEFYGNPATEIALRVAGVDWMSANSADTPPLLWHSEFQIWNDGEADKNYDSWFADVDLPFMDPGSSRFDISAILASSAPWLSPPMDFITSVELAAMPPGLGNDRNEIRVAFGNSNLRAQVENVTVVPVPAVGWLVGPVLGLLAAIRTRRSSS